MFDPILVPTWLHFGNQNPPKSTQKSIPRGIQKMIDFWIDFLAKLAPFWDPSWDPRAAQDGPKTPPRIFFLFSKTPPGQPPKPMGYPPGPRFSRFLARLNSNFAGLCESRCLFRAALYTSPPNTQSPANFHPLDILVQINPQST